MPDWSYHPLSKLLINRLAPKKGRSFLLKSMNSVARIPGGAKLIQFLGHMENKDAFTKCEPIVELLSSPVGLSCKADPYCEGSLALQHLGFGLLEFGPITAFPTQTLTTPFKRDNQIFIPEEKIELKEVLRFLTKQDIVKPLLFRLDSYIASPELLHLIIRQLYPFSKYFIVTPMQLHSVPALPGVQYFLSLETDELHTLNENEGIAGVILQAPRLREGIYTTRDSSAINKFKENVQQLRSKWPELPIITSGGISEPKDGMALLEAGANLILCEEEYVENGPGLPKRINEMIAAKQQVSNVKKRWLFHFLFGLSIFIAGIIATIFALTTVILPYDEQFIGLTRDTILGINENILLFMEHDRMSLAGTMISAGLIYMALSYFGIRRNLHWAKVAFHSAAITGFIGILLFIGYGYFDWLHGLFWLLLLPIYYGSWREAKKIEGAPSSTYGENTIDWGRGVYGQLLFVLLGGLLLVGGIVISIIGITTIFVQTDIEFICMPPEMIQEISDTLLPVIAHDRAGFGSALISVGLLVLCTALWGYRAGEKWLWWMFAIGALPAFIAGIGTHFAIGYTSFIHLSPLYFLVLLYLAGLVFSFEYLINPKRK